MRYRYHSPPSAEILEELLKLAPRLPADYLDFIRKSDGAVLQGQENHLLLFRVRDVIDQTLGYQKHSGGLIFIGSDGGALGYCIDRKEPHAYWEIHFMDIGEQAPEKVADTFEQFVSIKSV
jgi:hypothetical protein